MPSYKLVMSDDMDSYGFGEKTDPLKAAKFSFGPSRDPARRSFFALVRNFDLRNVVKL